ncbi:MAG: SgcJ/EcaC family oxidoreductase [Pseudomonadota bacterium]
MTSQIEQRVRALHEDLLSAWNRRDARGFAALFAPDGESIGFDGSDMVGPAEIKATSSRIFADHPTAEYVAKVRTIREIAPGVAVLRAVVGMVPRGGTELNPATNAVQVLVAVQRDRLLIASFQNTPAAYHGRPEAAQRLTEELKTLVAAQ